MMPLFRAELRKLFTIRSTYVIFAVALLISGFIAFWVMGYKSSPYAIDHYMEVASTASTIIAIFVAITAALLVAHEYRYNTIMYTLTSSNSRSRVLLAKVLISSLYAVGATIFASAFGVLLAWIGVQVRGGDLIAQNFYLWDTMWPSLFLVWGYTMVAVLIAALVRHVVGAIVVLLIVPGTIEGLLSLVLKENAKYLPFSALEQVHTQATMSAGKGALIFMIYLVVGWAITWFLFMKRDAN